MNRYFISILAVGVSGGSEGPGHNLKWLQRFVKGEAGVSFQSLLDEQATHTSIKDAIRRMYMRAQNNTQLVLYHCGHGDDNNALDLSESDEVITESILDKWIKELRQEAINKGLSNNVKVLIIFDFCRVNISQPPVNLSPGVVCIWACSPGESATCTNLDDNLPASLLLNALLVAADDVQLNPDASFFQRVKARAQQVQRTFRGIVCWGHRGHVCFCSTCLIGGCCSQANRSEGPELVNQTITSSASSVSHISQLFISFSVTNDTVRRTLTVPPSSRKSSIVFPGKFDK